MKAELFNLSKQVVGEVVLEDRIFALDSRVDIVKRVIDWQLAKRRAGTHKVKTVSEVAGSGKKPFKQKGTGNARQGNVRAVQIRGGGVSHGPVVRSHAIKLPKKVRTLGLKYALSHKNKSGTLYIVDLIRIDTPKTAELAKLLYNFGKGKFFIIEKEIDNNIKLSLQSIADAKVVPVVGANVYDIIKSDYILIGKEALPLLEERLK